MDDSIDIGYKETYSIETEVETYSTGKQFNELLKDVISNLSSRENVESTATPVNRKVSPIITRDETHYWTTIKSEYGEQEKGFLINVEVEGRDEFDATEARAIMESIITSIDAVFNVV